MAAPPVKRSVAKPLLWLFVAWLFFGGPMMFAVHRLMVQTPVPSSVVVPEKPRSAVQRGRTRPRVGISREQSEKQVVLVGLALVVVSALLLWRSAAALQFNRLEHPRLLFAWQSAFLCRGCGTIFHPQHGSFLAREA